MSVEKQEVPVLSMLDQLKVQYGQFLSQREIAQTNLNQLVGAIFACELMIKKYEEDAKGLSKENLGDAQNGEAKCEQTECAA